jgi:hypothetical protein
MLYLINAIVLGLIAAWVFNSNSEGKTLSIPFVEDGQQKYVVGGLVFLVVINLWAMAV